MNDDERHSKSRLHIHTGGLILFAIILIILFRVDIKTKIESPQFQKNINYIETKIKDFWQKNISGPLKEKMGGLFVDLTNKGMKKIQDEVMDNLKMPDVNNLNPMEIKTPENN